MTYVMPNFQKKKDLLTALEAGYPVSVYEPGLGEVPANGIVHLEGPHAPAAHTWYATGTMRDGHLAAVK